MTTTSRRLAAICLLLFVCSCSGCRPGRRPVKMPAAPPELPGGGNAKGIKIRWRKKSRIGGVQKILDLEADSGNLDHATESGQMNGARGTLYRDDKPRATFTAPIVEATKDRKAVMVTGGIDLKSIEPVGMTITADSATWYPEKNRIVLEGHVYLEQRKPETNQIVMRGRTKHLTINTELESFSIP